jgi:hypothetical protein
MGVHGYLAMRMGSWRESKYYAVVLFGGGWHNASR